MNDPIVGRIIGTDEDPSAPNTRPVIPIHPVSTAACGYVPPNSGPQAVAPASASAPGFELTRETDFASTQQPAVAVAREAMRQAQQPQPQVADPFAQAAPAPTPVVVPPTPAPAVVQAPVGPLPEGVKIPDALIAAINMVGGPETDAGKAILATLAPAQPKRTRRSKAEMAAVAPPAPEVAPVSGLVAQVAAPAPAAIQGELMAPAAAPAPIPQVSSVVAPTGQDDLLAGVDALLAGLQFDD